MTTFLESTTEIAPPGCPSPANGANIIGKAQEVGLDPRILYEAVIDLSADGLLTANCINLAAGILLGDLGLPSYFFATIRKPALVQLLQSIASSIRVVNGQAELFGHVAHIDFDLSYGNETQRVRIATEETRDSMEELLEDLLSGHRREYYFSPESRYYTYIIRPETVRDFPAQAFAGSRFLFALTGDYGVTPEPTRKRYEKFLRQCEKSTPPLIEAFNLPETGETRLMFMSDFESPQLPTLRKLLTEHGLTLVRAYWEPFLTGTAAPSSICSLYIREELNRRDEAALIEDLGAFLACALSPIRDLYLDGTLTFPEMLFAGNVIDFTHLFIFKESENATDREIMRNLVSRDHREAFARRIQDANKTTYGASLIEQSARKNPDLLRTLYRLFARRFAPRVGNRITDDELEVERREFEKKISSRFIDFSIGVDIFRFMFKLVSCTLKTNFFCSGKRSFSFRFDNRILDPLVFGQPVYGIFFVNGHYSCGTHLRSGDIARGGLRLLRVSRSNHDAELDGAVLLNYALGPKAQRLKHKDICESGSKGVVVPHPLYAEYGKEALFDFTEGIMDLILRQDPSIIDYYGKPEMIFFGPDEGTAPFMDAVALRAKERGYRHWRTLTTGKAIGIPHDSYGVLASGEIFALFGRGEEGVELQIDGEQHCITKDMEDIHAAIGDNIAVSGMTTTSVMGSFRTVLDHAGLREEDLNLMMTGGPDGDLGANEIQCYKGKICLVIDGGSVLFDPEGLDKKELRKLAFWRNSVPRINTLGYPRAKLGAAGFMVPVKGHTIELPDGAVIEDGALFHRTFLTNPANRRYIEQANIRSCIPCGGVKDTVHQGNVREFLANFQELQFIVEGANVFFDSGARRYIAANSAIIQIKDTSANKGGVFSSSIAEVLTAFLFEDEYEVELLHDKKTRWELIKNVLLLVEGSAKQETEMLLRLHAANPEVPLFDLSEQSSESIFALQEQLEKKITTLLADPPLIREVLNRYIPAVLAERLGLDRILDILGSPDLQSYRNAIITKKLAAMAFYRFGTDWAEFSGRFEHDMSGALHSILEQ